MWRIAGSTGAVGFEVAVAIAVGYFGGQWLDQKFGTTPWLTIVGFFAGVGAAIKALVRVTRDYRKKLAQDQDAEKDTAQNPQGTDTETHDPSNRTKDTR